MYDFHVTQVDANQLMSEVEQVARCVSGQTKSPSRLPNVYPNVFSILIRTA